MSLFFVYGLSEDGVLVYYVHRLLLFWFVCHFDWPAPVVLWEVVTMEIVRINKIDNFAPQRSRSIDKAGYSMHARSIIQPGKFSTSWKRKCEFKAKRGENKENKNLSFGARILLLRHFLWERRKRKTVVGYDWTTLVVSYCLLPLPTQDHFLALVVCERCYWSRLSLCRQATLPPRAKQANERLPQLTVAHEEYSRERQ